MIVKVPGYSEPFLASIPESPLALEMDRINISAEEKYEHNREILKDFSKALPRVSYQEINRLNFEEAKPKPDSVNQDDGTEQSTSKSDNKTNDFLMAVTLNQYKDTLTEISKKANLTAGTGSRIAKRCESKGLIKIIKVGFGKGCPRYPVLLPEAYKVLGVEEKKFYGKGAGIKHVLYQHLVAKHFSGFKPAIELNRNNKFLDVGIILSSGKLVAIEIAMTAVNEKVNIEKDITMAKADFVVVACKDDKVLEKVNELIDDLSEDLICRTKVCLIGDLFRVTPDEFVEGIIKKCG